MTPEVIIIQRPNPDFTMLLGIGMKVLGRSLSAQVDASSVRMADTDRYLSCLASMRESNADAHGVLGPRLLPHVSFGVLVVADEPDMLDILECAAGMVFVFTETLARNVQMAVVTGNLAQWRDAVLAGSAPEIESTVRCMFNKLHGLFRSEGVNLWSNFRQKPASDQRTYLLEHKRGRG